MSTATTSAPAHVAPQGKGVNFARMVKSEWIKVRTLRSTTVLLILTVVAMVGFGALNAWGTTISAEFSSDVPPEAQAQMAETGGIQGMAYSIPPSGVAFGQLLFGSLAVVLIASEYATGMIRSTLVAAPQRIKALLAKVLVITVVAFVVGVLSALITYFVAQPILAGEELDYALSVDGLIPSIINTGTFLALVAIMGMSIGALLRNSAGGIVTIVALLMVLPIVFQLIPNDFFQETMQYLPSSAGTQLVSVQTADDALTQLQGGLVMAAWALVLLIAACLTIRRRDV
ncbi:ABC transporter permease [Arthrobacter sp. H14]|uniref:ABC transporter permease n=1 Tax=Arthrobacter sp. H14 TaxID=1312959 RepID=UPI0004790D2B|nr:ABC transporter permease [Arthrobacter sp. H14]